MRSKKSKKIDKRIISKYLDPCREKERSQQYKENIKFLLDNGYSKLAMVSVLKMTDDEIQRKADLWHKRMKMKSGG